jgi:protein-S-isoprenylcysteine O-methyltransferase Ste14
VRRHELDPLSLFAGLVFVAIAAGYAVSHTTDVRLDWLVAVPAVLLALGGAILLIAVRRMVGTRQRDGAAPAEDADEVSETS